MGLQRLQRVSRARRDVTAHRRAAGPDQLGGSHRETGQSRRIPHLRLRSFNSSPTISCSSVAEARSSDAKTPSRYSPSASTAPSRVSSRSVSRMRRRTRLRTTAVPTDLGTARWTRAAPGAARNDTLKGPRRMWVAAGGCSCAPRPLDRPLTPPVGSVPYDGGLAGRRVRSASAFWPESRVSCAFSLCWAEKGVSLEDSSPRHSLARVCRKKAAAAINAVNGQRNQVHRRAAPAPRQPRPRHGHRQPREPPSFNANKA